MRDFEGELGALLDKLLAEGIAECLDCGFKKTKRIGLLFEEIKELQGVFSCCVSVEVSPHHRSEPWNVEALVYAGREETHVVWRHLWQEGEAGMMTGEAAASCEAQLRRDHPSVFGAYDALREQIELEFTADPTSAAVRAQRL